MLSFKERFERAGFFIVRNVTDTGVYHRKALAMEGTGRSDRQCPLSDSFYGKMNDLQLSLHQEMERLTGLELLRTYNYLRIYRKGETLRIHRDRPACEVSMTLCLGLRGDPWPIHILDYDDRAHTIRLKPGDGLVYRGCDLRHWRDRNTWSEVLTQMFLHFVDRHGPYAWAGGDAKVGPFHARS
jgi:hypothetical protein